MGRRRRRWMMSWQDDQGQESWKMGRS